MKEDTTPGNSLSEQGKDTTLKTEMQRFYEFLFTHVATCSMASKALGIPQKHLTRRKRDLEKEGKLVEVYEARCKLTKHRAAYLTTNPKKFPTKSAQLTIFQS